MAMKRTEFQVEGSGPFPIDMLRYDSCFPSTGEDVAAVTAVALNDTAWMHPRRVTLAVHHEGKHPNITPERWRSFGWPVRGVVTRPVGSLIDHIVE